MVCTDKPAGNGSGRGEPAKTLAGASFGSARNEAPSGNAPDEFQGCATMTHVDRIDQFAQGELASPPNYSVNSARNSLPFLPPGQRFLFTCADPKPAPARLE